MRVRLLFVIAAALTVSTSTFAMGSGLRDFLGAPAEIGRRANQANQNQSGGELGNAQACQLVNAVCASKNYAEAAGLLAATNCSRHGRELVQRGAPASGENGINRSFQVVAYATDAVPDKSDCLIDVCSTTVEVGTKPIDGGIVTDIELGAFTVAVGDIHDAMLLSRHVAAFEVDQK